MNTGTKLSGLIVLLYAGVFGQAVSISGKVTNSSGGAPLKDVAVTLMHRPDVSGITNAAGMYNLSSTSAAKPGLRLQALSGGEVTGNSINFTVNRKTTISIDIINASGSTVRNIVSAGNYAPGSYSVNLAHQGLAAGLYMVRFTQDNVSTMHRYMPMNWRGIASRKPVLVSDAAGLSRGLAAAADTLIFTLPAFGVARVPVTAYSSTTPHNAALQAYPVYKNMRQLPGGTFQMGLVDSISDWGPVHDVTLSSFYIDTTEVTQAEYQAVMKVNPAHFTDGVTYPVEYLTWFDGILFCNARSKRDGFDTMYRYTSVVGEAGNGCSALENLSINNSASKSGYRLPTEAQWEYACRAGTTTLYYWGNDMNDDYCWNFSNGASTTHPVATRKPNQFGLYDMTGNVWEFCWDWEAPYTAGAQTDPTGPASKPVGGGSRIIRGASYAYNASNYWYSACRNGYSPDYQDYHWNTGFRCVR